MRPLPVEFRTAGTQTERGGDLLTEYDKVAIQMVRSKSREPRTSLSSRAGRVLVYRLGGLVRLVLGSAQKEAWYCP